VGKNTLIAALGCLSHLSELLAFEYNGDNKLLRNLSSRYAEGHEHEVNQATEYSVKWLQWAESMVLGQFPASIPEDLVGAMGLVPHLTAKIMSKWRQHFWYTRHRPSGYHDPGIGAPLREQCECRRGGLDRQCNRPSRRESNGLHTCLACTFRRCACLCDECMAEVVAVTPQYFNTTEPDQKKKKKRSRPQKHQRARYHDVREGLYQMIERDPDGFDLESVELPQFISKDVAGKQKLLRALESKVGWLRLTDRGL
jgi:hypothetical protein